MQECASFKVYIIAIYIRLGLNIFFWFKSYAGLPYITPAIRNILRSIQAFAHNKAAIAVPAVIALPLTHCIRSPPPYPKGIGGLAKGRVGNPPRRRRKRGPPSARKLIQATGRIY